MPFDFNLILLSLATLLALGVIGLVLWMLIQRFLISKREVTRSLNMILFLVTVPREKSAEEPEKGIKEMIAVAEQFHAGFSNIKEKWLKSLVYGPPHIALEIANPSMEEEISFYIGVPRRFEGLVEKQITSLYPKAKVERIEDYNIFNPKGKVACQYLRLGRPDIYPLKTYEELESDPLNAILNALSKIEKEGEGAAVQILVRPAPSSWYKGAEKIAQKMYQKATAAPGGPEKGLQKELLKYLKTSPPKPETKPSPPESTKKPSPLEEEAVKAIEQKVSKLGFVTNIRLITSAPTKERAEQLLSHLKGAFAQFASPAFNRFITPRVLFPRKLIYDFIFRNFKLQGGFILNIEELAGIFHFPTPFTEVSKVKAVRAKTAPPPANMPEQGLVLGRNTFRGEETIVKMTKDDRRRHLYIIGQTGTGKSTFLQSLILQDIINGEGVGVVDPHGDLIEGVLANIPKARAEDVILFEPFDLQRPMGLNMLEYKTEEQKDFAVGEMINIFHKLFPPEYVGPMCEHYMRNAMLTLMADKESPGTLTEIPRILTDENFIKYKVAKVTDPVVRAFWEKEWAKTSEFHKSEMLGYLISKIGAFIENEMMRNIIGQPRSAFDFREVMDEQKILLANLSKGKVGELNSALLGLIIVSKLQMAAMSRVDVPEEQRKDYYLYMDEFQNFTTETVATILAEARKYRLCLTIAHQFIGQLDEKIRDAVFGNVGSMVCFRIGAEDAGFVVKQYEPVFSEGDLINIDNFNAYLKLMIRGETSRAFSIQTYPPQKGNPEITQALRDLSRLKYGSDRGVVAKEILARSQLGASEAIKPTFVPGEKTG